MKQKIKELSALAAKNATHHSWEKIVRSMDALSINEQEDAVAAVEAAWAHWPATYSPAFQRRSRIVHEEVRISPPQYGWTQELISGASYPKHRLLRGVRMPCNRWEKTWKATNLNAAIKSLSHLVIAELTSSVSNPVSTEMIKAWQGDGAWQQWERLSLSFLPKTQTKELGSAKLDSLRALDLHVKTGALDGFKKSAAPPKLEELTLRGLEDVAALDSLLKFSWVRGIKRLGLQYIVLDEARLSAICDAHELHKIERLHLSMDRMQVGIQKIPLGWLAKLRNLKSLSINSAAWPDSNLAAVLEHLPDLEELDTMRLDIGKESADAIAQYKGDLKVLGFDNHNTFGEDSLEKILRSPAAKHLEHISFGPDLGMKTIKLLAEGACPKLVSFRLNRYEGNPIEDFIKKDPRLKKMKLNGASYMDNNYEANT